MPRPRPTEPPFLRYVKEGFDSGGGDSLDVRKPLPLGASLPYSFRSFSCRFLSCFAFALLFSSSLSAFSIKGSVEVPLSAAALFALISFLDLFFV